MSSQQSAWIEIDGAQGEGGGQILRTALTLSAITGQPFELINIRARRTRPGLLRQHLTAVEATRAICDAAVEGASAGSMRLRFSPGRMRGGDYRFAIGTAGSCTLVLQTALPLLWFAPEPASILVSGGTHNPAAPPADFLIRAWLPLIWRMGVDCRIALNRHGFYPAGGGELHAQTQPGRPGSLHLNERGKLKTMRATAIVAGVPVNVARRELEQLAQRFPDAEQEVIELPQQHGPGNALVLEAEFEHVTEVFTRIGQRGISAEQVAKRLAGEVQHYLASQCAVAGHLADQLLLPLALTGGGGFTTSETSSHFMTNIAVIEKFLAVKVRCEQLGKGWLVSLAS